MDFAPRVRTALESAGYKGAASLLTAPPSALLKTNLSEDDIQNVKLVAAKSLGLKVSNAADICKISCGGCLSTGCRDLDKVLRGGLPVEGITEIAGESGSGKTQICLQLCLMVQYPTVIGGLAGGAVYICTEGAFPSVRLKQLSQFFKPPGIDNVKCHALDPERVGDNIFIEHIADVVSSLLQI